MVAVQERWQCSGANNLYLYLPSHPRCFAGASLSHVTSDCVMCHVPCHYTILGILLGYSSSVDCVMFHVACHCMILAVLLGYSSSVDCAMFHVACHCMILLYVWAVHQHTSKA